MGIVARLVTRFMSLTDRLRFLFGPATRGDVAAPVIHTHDDFEAASEEDLSQFEVESDSEGHHYAVRKEDLPKERA
ncbi:hypothetical protein [Arthrobacter sp. 92]|jgi:hypothetical protein|uniref:hypothetical protein n=1 Tax=Arthrobacter sp. 92 TaxID=3418175 RepID=UPI003D0835FE